MDAKTIIVVTAILAIVAIVAIAHGRGFKAEATPGKVSLEAAPDRPTSQLAAPPKRPRRRPD